jgi:hypothetical protein
MAHTEGRYMQDLGFTDGKIRAVPSQEVIAFGTTVLTRTAAGNINYAQAASQAVTYDVNLSTLLQRRLGFFEDLQEQFGGAGIAGSAQIRDYRPDVRSTGAAPAGMSVGQQITPRTAFKTKGFRLISYDIIYQITTNPLTVHTTRVDQTVYTQGVAAPVITPVLASAANGLQTAVSANLYVTTVVPAVQLYFTLNDADVWIEEAVTTPAGGTFTLWGFDVAFEFNFN